MNKIAKISQELETVIQASYPESRATAAVQLILDNIRLDLALLEKMLPTSVPVQGKKPATNSAIAL